ncbi:mannitol dehydrogenase family protein [Acuticoccus sp. I52.16.1]|uniref:mannitol dehydrogenase family protein n=1 Tax=Acuticoccus sp. I52.16.1 TaxID=2928472 RepID=UPI001FD2F454|nr:mannitol dehydrogenase family protein [Acuticoccus sp. I52.16.1]UOM37014.1 mannitol dehydrogenase family protein [Acuticoccus sp. I52.16.1]
MIRLSAATLPQIRSAATPRYDRAALKPGIVHFGIGNFHRAHQAVYLDRLFSMGRDHDFGIVGAGVMAGDQKMREALTGQDLLTTVVEQSAEASEARVTAPMVGFLPIGDTTAILARLTDPETRIVSLTVTEGGYFVDSTGVFNPQHPDIVHDGERPTAPRTVFGLIAAALSARRASGTAPFTVMCCDNIPHNGSVTRAAVVGTAGLHDAALASWIASEVAFPNAMVDRITPATGERERRLCAENFGIEDAWPVFCEDFTQWVLEDTFPSGRPALEEVGVEFVADVTPYELMKIRILNGGHAVIAYPAGLLGITYVHEAMAHPSIAAFLAKITRDEIIPTVPPVPGTSLADYARLIETRCANPKIGDTVRRLCLDGSNRQPKFIVPTLADRIAEGRSITGLALESALWCRYCVGETEAGEAIAPNDPNWERLQPVARAAQTDPAAWLGQSEIYGALGSAPVLRERFAAALASLKEAGVEATLQRYLDDDL